jgi:carbamoyl-phosphate synthase/aspartate carbamoyltransferase/dihydroorotase
MPNTQPPICDTHSLLLTIQTARQKSCCDYALFLGAGPDNAHSLSSIAEKSAGLKMYLNQTYGALRLDNISMWMEHFENWPMDMPIVAHAEGHTMAALILMAALYDRPVHIAHVSLREEIFLIRAAKEKGVKVSCEVTPHHLFLTENNISRIGSGRSEVRPRLASEADRNALWENLDVIDCFATDHAPHLPTEKDSQSPPPGFPGLETALPLLLMAVQDGLLSMDDLFARMYTNPKRIFKIPDQSETWIEVDLESNWEINAVNMYSRCGWTPFEGWKVPGKLRRVVFHNQEVYKDGQLTAKAGIGKNLRDL